MVVHGRIHDTKEGNTAMISLGRSLTAAWGTRRGRSLLMCAACLSGLGVYVGAGGTVMGVGPSEAVAAVASSAGVSDPTQLLGMRSPGARDGDSLRTTKPPRLERVPHERVLTSFRDHEVTSFVPDVPFAGFEAPPFPVEFPFEVGGFYPGVPSWGSGFVPGLPGGGLIGGGWFIGGGGGFIGGGGGGGVLPGTPGTPGVPVVTAPVPEPATWVSMILGFAVVGGTLRRSRSMRRREVLAA